MGEISNRKYLKMIERNIHALKYRKATHLAGIDVAEIIKEKGKCIVTIKDAYYNNQENIAGKTSASYVLVFEEDIMPMIVNRKNKDTITDIHKAKGLSLTEAGNIGNWIGTKIELFFNESVKFGKETTGGIRVKSQSPIPDVSDENAIKILNTSTTIKELAENWEKLSKQEKNLPSVMGLKNDLKDKLSTNDKP